jgi:hypothetical protein
MVLYTWTNISLSNWQFLIPCYHQNSQRFIVKHILFQHSKHDLFSLFPFDRFRLLVGHVFSPEITYTFIYDLKASFVVDWTLHIHFLYCAFISTYNPRNVFLRQIVNGKEFQFLKIRMIWNKETFANKPKFVSKNFNKHNSLPPNFSIVKPVKKGY